ncbi:hypothetical protein BB559_006210 [Furculomyces boomerangus]|uniref:DUS-like FMN-binding domain-containing protein n=1 Tax=Furculomyces boomerangus TaxID=61424 RepID=A0A2T9Y4C7_9FUNG|nr:hypothetical protein BB559_006210 [Furculomyces boomerangus]
MDRYRTGLFLAPMVRIGTLPMRILALEQGADLVWTPEIVDKSMVDCERVQEESGVVRYLRKGTEIFACHVSEKSKLIFQIGSADPEIALSAAKVVEQDVSGFDLNCGCPKKFSLQGGMGASLLYNPDLLCSILKNLVNNVSVPVTCKIRVLPSEEETIKLVKRLAETGISAITVHCRTRDMRYRTRAMWDRIIGIKAAVDPLPVVLNGDVFSYDTFLEAKEKTGITSAMVARGVYGKISVFSKNKTILSEYEMIKRYIVIAEYTKNLYPNSKYTLLQILSETKSEKYFLLQKAKTYGQLREIFDIAQEYVDDYLESNEFLKHTKLIPDSSNASNGQPHTTLKRVADKNKDKDFGNGLLEAINSSSDESPLKKEKL